MIPTQKWSIHLFRFAGVDVFLHWSWFLAAAILLILREPHYSSVLWNLLEYISLFFIVLLHEFGHALACRQVGGQANLIVLWPLGGVAYVDPPMRPGATLWSIAAGPLVNVVLMPILIVVWLCGLTMNWEQTMPDGFELLTSILKINATLLLFNMMPIYPLDGGQILRSLLWFVTGRARSLMIVSVIGTLGAISLLLFDLLLYLNDAEPVATVWLAILSGFMLLHCWGGFQHARILIHIARRPRRVGFACPECRSVPPVGDLWHCSRCGGTFDTFLTTAFCPYCRVQTEETQCLDCGAARPLYQWLAAVPPPPAGKN